jgi:hypothetical protein
LAPKRKEMVITRVKLEIKIRNLPSEAKLELAVMILISADAV